MSIAWSLHNRPSKFITHDTAFYVIEGREMARIEQVMRCLYAENRLTGDDMRDLAQMLNCSLDASIERGTLWSVK